MRISMIVLVGLVTGCGREGGEANDAPSLSNSASSNAPAPDTSASFDAPNFNDQPLSEPPLRPPPPPGIKQMRRDAITLALSGDGKYMAGGDLAGQALLWDLERGKFMWADLTPEGNRLGRVAFAGAAPIYMAGAFHEPDKPWRIWSAELMERKGELGEAGWIGLDVAIDDAGKRAVTLSSSRDGKEQRVELWDLVAMKSLASIPMPSADIGAVAIDASGTRFAAANPKAVFAWAMEADAPKVFVEGKEGASRVALAEGATLYATRNEVLTTWASGGQAGAVDTRPIGTELPIRGLHRTTRVGMPVVMVKRPEDGGLHLFGSDGKLIGGIDTGCRCEMHALSLDGKVAACGCESAELRWGPVRYE